MKNYNIVYKINSIKNIINTKPAIIDKIFVLQKNDKTLKIVQIAKKESIRTYFVKKINQKELNYIKRNFAVIAKIKQIKKINLDTILEEKKNLKILILDRVQDPHNLSSCIRTAEAFAIDLIVTSKKNSTKLSSLINSLSNGSSLLTNIIEEDNIKSIIRKFKKKNIRIIGLSAKAKEETTAYTFTGSIAILMGSEKDGIKNELKKECDKVLKIKMNNENKSINLSVATGIILSKF